MSAVAERSSITALAGGIVEHLHGVRERLAGEIRTYPTPIPRCDAQFNHLYEQQGRLLRDLDRIEATRESIERFVASAPYTDDAAERDFRSRVKAALAALD
ncbi:MAG TPA: hypothetical protein VJO54_06520 [Burkholderiales bacterium]|nr:hypothetical protein [Burkholderiales bacterium]